MRKHKENLDMEIVPIFFACDDNYVPYLDVTLVSLIENASKEYCYKIHILNTGLKKKNMKRLSRFGGKNIEIIFVDASDYIGAIHKKFSNIFHYGLAAYYRLFIEGMFPQYDKVLYLDCDIVVLGDISKLYKVDIQDYMLAAVRDGFVPKSPEFIEYVEKAVGISFDEYFNSGILVINLKKFRENQIEEKFKNLLCTYNFDTVDPDQAYLNYFCRGKVKFLPSGWNKTPAYEKYDGDLNIIHYALTIKPWQCDVEYGEYFWNFAKKSKYYKDILKTRKQFSQQQLLLKKEAGIEIIKKAVAIVNSGKSFFPTLGFYQGI